MATINNSEIEKYGVDYYTKKTMDMMDAKGVLGVYTEKGVRANVEAWMNNKSNLMKLLRKHPNWNEEAKAVVFTNEEIRMPDRNEFICAFNDLLYTAESDYPEYYRDIIKIRTRDDGWTYRLYNILTMFRSSFFDTVVSESFVNNIIYYYPKEAEAIHLAAGQKFSRVLNRLFKYCGLDQMKEYNRLYAKISDSINPLKATKISVLSVNFLDYLLMSNGNSWSTCQTIVDHNNCSGIYKAGALSYANDKLTMVYYTINKDYEGTDYCLEPKITRQLFFYKDNLLVQERLYPKTHDCDDSSSEISLVAQYRNLVEDIIATCEGKPNFWEKAEVTICATSDSFMYRDWDHFTNWKYKIKDEEIPKRITVGSTSYCLRCGKARDFNCGREDDEEHRDLYCEECHYYVRCAGCGKEFRLSTGWNSNYTIIGNKYYILECGCVTYCNYHNCYELTSENEFTEVRSLGLVCKDALHDLIEDRRLFKCSHCGKYSMIARGSEIMIRFCNSKPVCSDCLDELTTDGYSYDMAEMTYITYAS